MAIDFKVTFTGGSPEDRKNDDFKVEDAPQTSERDSGDASTSSESEMKIPSLERTHRTKQGLDDKKLSDSLSGIDSFNKKDLNKVATDLGIKGATKIPKTDLLNKIKETPSFKTLNDIREAKQVSEEKQKTSAGKITTKIEAVTTDPWQYSATATKDGVSYTYSGNEEETKEQVRRKAKQHLEKNFYKLAEQQKKETSKSNDEYVIEANELETKFFRNPDGMTKKELLEFAVNKGIKGLSALTKPRLIKQLETELEDTPNPLTESSQVNYEYPPDTVTSVTAEVPLTEDDGYPASWDLDEDEDTFTLPKMSPTLRTEIEALMESYDDDDDFSNPEDAFKEALRHITDPLEGPGKDYYDNFANVIKDDPQYAERTQWRKALNEAKKLQDSYNAKESEDDSLSYDPINLQPEVEVNSVSDEDLIKQTLQDTPEASIMPMAKLRDIAGITDSDRFNNAVLNLEKEGYLDLTKHPDIGNESPSRVSTFVPFRDGYAENIIKRTQPKVETPKKPVDPPVEKKPTVTIEPAFRQTKTGKDVKDGYDVFINDEWHERYPTKKAAKAAQPIGDSLIFDPSRTVSDTSNKTPGPQSMLADIDFKKQKDKKAKEAKREKKAATPEPESNLLSNINDDEPSVPNNPAPSIPEALREITNDAVKDLFDHAASGGGGGDEPPVKTTFDMPDPEDDDSDDPESLLKFAETNTDPDPTPRVPNKKDADAPLFEFADANEDDGYADLPDVKSVMPDVTKPEVMGNFQKELDKIAAKERKALQVALTQAKRRADKQTKVKARRYEKEQGKRRRKIDNESKIRKAEILESNKRADSDRMIRRLTTFGIGRAVGIDGGMLTALAELFVFQPEADKEQAELDKRLKEVQDDRSGQIADLDKAKTLTAENRDWQSVDIAEIIDDARLRLGDEENPTQLPEVERELASVLNKNLNVFSAKDDDDLYTGPIDIVGKKSPSIDPTERNHKDSVTTADEASDSSKTPPRTASDDDPSVSGPGASQTQQNANTAATGASSGGGSGGSGGNKPPTVSGNPPSPAGKGGGGGGFINNIVSLFGSNLSSATGKLLAAQIALQSLATASDLAEAGIKKIGSAIDDPYSVQSQNAAVDIGGDLSKGIGTVAGGAIGGAIGGPMGAVAGSIVGKAVSSAIIDPLIAFVEIGTQQLDSLAKQSMGPRTIQSRVDQSIEKLIKRMELSDRLDDTTSTYVNTQTDFGSALSDLKGALAEMFGPPIVTVMKGVTALVKITELIILLTNLINIVQGIQIYQQANNWLIEQILNVLEWALSWFRSSNNTNQAMLNSVYGFFGNNASQAVQGSATTFRNTFAGGNAGFNP